MPKRRAEPNTHWWVKLKGSNVFMVATVRKAGGQGGKLRVFTASYTAWCDMCEVETFIEQIHPPKGANR